MNATRRSIFTALALPATLAPALAFAASAGATACPDADLLALGEAWDNQRALCDRLNAEDCALCDAARAAVPKPEALKARPSDQRDLWATYRVGEFFSSTQLVSFRRRLAECRALEPYPNMSALMAERRADTLARLEEIITAKDQHDQDFDDALEANGANAAIAAYAKAAGIESDLVAQIREAKATTLAGFATKARVDLWYAGENERSHTLEQLAAAA